MSKKRKPVPSRGSEGMSPQALVLQLDQAQADAARYQAERNAWAARCGALIRLGRPVGIDEPRLQNRLERVAAALLLAAKVSDPVVGVNVTDGPGRITTSQAHPIPGASTEHQRRHATRLRTAIDTALDQWDHAVEHAFDPPKPPRPPKVRCRNPHCSARDVWMDAWRTVRGGRTVPYERCCGCGQPVDSSPETETQAGHGIS